MTNLKGDGINRCEWRNKLPFRPEKMPHESFRLLPIFTVFSQLTKKSIGYNSERVSNLVLKAIAKTFKAQKKIYRFFSHDRRKFTLFFHYFRQARGLAASRRNSGSNSSVAIRESSMKKATKFFEAERRPPRPAI